MNNTINQLQLPDISRTLQQTIAKHTFSSSMHGTLSRTDQMIGHKTNLSKF